LNYWQKNKGKIIAGGLFGLGVGGGFLLPGDGIWYGLGGKNKPIPIVEIEPRKMPDQGLDSNPSTGGLDSDSRGMGQGISGKNFIPKTIGFSFSF
jgi:hypothetical protein